MLKSCLSGVPLDIVKNVDHSISAMWKRLDDKYGEPSKIIDVIMNEVKRLKPVKENENAKFINLIDVVERAYRDLERLHLEHELSNAQTVSSIEEKIPMSMKLLWAEHVKCRMASTANKFPELLKFLLERKSIIEYAIADLRSLESGTSGSVHMTDQHKTNESQEAGKNQSSKNDVNTGTSSCLIHNNGNHTTDICDIFLKKSVNERIEIIKETNACWSCLKVGHQSAWCWFRKKCTESDCNMFHHKLLHQDQTEGTALHTNPSNTPADVNRNSCLLQLMKITASNDQKVNVLWDGGATLSLITFRKANELGLEGKHINLSVTKVGGKSEQINSNKYELTLKDKKGKNVDFIVYGIDKISSEVRDIDISSASKLFSNVNLKDLQRPTGEIDILIGFEYAGYHPARMQNNGHLLVMENQFGKCLSGSHPSIAEKTVKFVQHAVIHHAKGISMEPFFDVEGLGVTCTPKCGSCRCGKCAIGGKDFTIKEEHELKMIERGLTRHSDHWEASYPWLRKPSSLEDNRSVAAAILKSTEKRLLKDKELSRTYKEQIDDMVDRNVARKLTDAEIKNHSGPVQYLSHHEVIKKESSSTPCRIVFNSSAKFKGISLNDCWAKGPDILNNMLGILLRFREGEIAFTGDIKKMYHTIHLSEEDRHMHRFLWRDLDTERKMDTYIMMRVSFGDKPAGTIAAVALQKTAREYEGIYPDAVDTILSNTYVDDIIESLHKTSNSDSYTNKIDEILQSGGFSIKQWISNESVSNKQSTCVPKEINNEVSKVLGMYWNPLNDEFQFKVKINFSPKQRKVRTGPDLTFEQLNMEGTAITKRMILSQINGIHDPYGFLVPFTMEAKVLMQNLSSSASKFGWDDSLPPDLRMKWIEYFKKMFDIEKLSFKRCVRPSSATENPTLIMFSDASEYAYGGCAYIRWKLDNGTFSSSLLCAKGRVAPIKRVTIPRLELCAAVVASRLHVFIKKECRFKFEKVIFIVDSKIVQAMIQKESYGFKTYASVRVGEIQAATKKESWAWTESEENIADWTTRMRSPNELGQGSDWQRGPKWLTLDETNWPISYCTAVDELPEVQQTAVANTVEVVASSNQRLFNIESYSSYARLIRVTSRVLAVFKKVPKPSLLHLKEDITIEGLKKAEYYWIKEAQSQYSDKDLLHRLQRLGARRREDGIITVGQRIESWMKNSYSTQEMLLLPFDHHISYLYVLKVHNQCHSGVSATVCKVRLKFWVVKLEKLARKVLSECVICKKNARKCVSQIMAPLPTERLNPSPPWSHTSLDLFEPFSIRGEVNKRSRGKAFGLILTCLASRALHIDLINGYSTDAFLQGFRRFMSFRGAPIKIYSDPGSQLEGANSELQLMINGLSNEKLKEFGVSNQMEWKFTSADAPWQNGCVESLIRACKKAISNAIGEQILTFSELLTVVYECAELGNERPIGKMNLDINDGSYLCPNDLLLGRATARIPGGPFDGASSLVKRYMFVQQIVDAFWVKWTRFYFPSLIVRQKWHVDRRNLCVGDIVLIQDSNTVRGRWKMGRICNVYPGSDGKVRNVEVEYKCNPDSKVFIKINRPVQRLVLLLPCDDNGDDNRDDNRDDKSTTSN